MGSQIVLNFVSATGHYEIKLTMNVIYSSDDVGKLGLRAGCTAVTHELYFKHLSVAGVVDTIIDGEDRQVFLVFSPGERYNLI